MITRYGRSTRRRLLDEGSRLPLWTRNTTQVPPPDPKPKPTGPTGPPVAKRRASARVFITFGIAILAGVLLLVFIVRTASKPGSKVRLGSNLYQVGPTRNLAETISKDGPVLNQALTKGGPDIYIQHLGNDPEIGWRVFEAQVPGSGRQCTLQWQAAAQQFLDPCTKKTYPADGTGLKGYTTVVAGGRLAIDLRSS